MANRVERLLCEVEQERHRQAVAAEIEQFMAQGSASFDPAEAWDMLARAYAALKGQ